MNKSNRLVEEMKLMKLNEIMVPDMPGVKYTVSIMRVPGGWNYVYEMPVDDGFTTNYRISTQFVPLPEKFN